MNKNLHFNTFATPMTTKPFTNNYKVETKDLEEYVISVPKIATPNPVPVVTPTPKQILPLSTPVVPTVVPPTHQSVIPKVVSPILPLVAPPIVPSVLPTVTPAVSNTDYLKCIDMLETFAQRLGNDEHEVEKIKGAIGRVSLHIGSVEKAIELQRIGNNDNLNEMAETVGKTMQSVESRTKQYCDKRLSDEVQQLDYKITVLNKKLQKDSCLTNLTGSLLGLVCIACLYQFFYMLFFKNMFKMNELQQFYPA